MDHIQTIDMDGMSDIERIDARLRALILSVEGTIPGSRDFGLPAGITDMDPRQAKNELIQALDEKVEKYIPQICVSEVDIEGSGDDTRLSVYIEKNDDMGDEDDSTD